MKTEEMIKQIAETLGKMYLEDVEFIHGFVMKLYKKKGGHS